MNNLTIRNHLSLLLMSCLTWVFFLLLGLPDYYQSWNPRAQLFMVFAVTVMYIPLGFFLIKKMFPNQNYSRNSIWLTVYLTVPLFAYDWMWIGYLGGEDWSYITKYWCQTFFYVSFWIQIPIIGSIMEKVFNERMSRIKVQVEQKNKGKYSKRKNSIKAPQGAELVD